MKEPKSNRNSAEKPPCGSATIKVIFDKNLWRIQEQASAPLLPTQNLLSLASTFLWEPMRFAFGIPIFKKVLSLSASEGFRREIASGIPKKLRNLSCFQPNSSEVALWRPRVVSQIE